MKKRLDVMLFEGGLATSREKAQALIMSGNVYIDNQKADKPGTSYDEGVKMELRGDGLKYVSRGGLKLEKAIATFGINLRDKVAMDIGASTGGFTDCMLKNGLAKVYAVDVGYGQLDWRLRTDERVVNLERTNIRYLDPGLLSEPIDFFSIDVSFISLKLVLPVVKGLMHDDAEVVCLIKPQFEAERSGVGKNGVVRDRKVHMQVIDKICTFARHQGFWVKGLNFSPVKGPKGNIEYLLYLRNAYTEHADEYTSWDYLEELTKKAHDTLSGVIM